MSKELDPEITSIQQEWLDRHRLAHRWMIAEDLDGFSVHDHTIDGVAPPSTYPTREQAAARLLQLLGIKEPVTPQNWPERVCIGSVGVSDDEA